jgi:pyruvate kinase
MLSAESAVGRYPVEAVKTLARIAAATEPFRASASPEEMFKGIDLRDRVPRARLIDLAVQTVLAYSSRALVFVPSYTGATARSIGRFRLPTWIIAVCSEEATCQHLQFSSGVYAAHEHIESVDWSTYCTDWVTRHGLPADLAIVTNGRGAADPDGDFKMEIVELERMNQTARPL